MSSQSPKHPGIFIKQDIIPKGVNVTKAAAKIGVARPTLSNLLNGNSALSPDMALKIERAFGGITAAKLMDMQAAHDAHQAKAKEVASPVTPYVPPFLQIKAADIEAWAIRRDSRSKLSVLLRTLINSTSNSIEKIDFPGHDNSERPGWDGLATCKTATPWVPAGMSGWEFGTNQNPRSKAEEDYAKSIKQTSSSERKDITFIFVTPRNWLKKDAWAKEKRALKNWKDVRAYDASDLEQWLEQSIPGQTWLANEIGFPTNGVLTLGSYWEEWSSCSPHLSEPLFDQAVLTGKDRAKHKLIDNTGEPLIIAADSTLEGLAFLHCLFSKDCGFSHLRDQVIVLNTPDQVRKLVSRNPNFIAVTASPETEKALAPHLNNLRVILIYPRSQTPSEPDIVLDALYPEDFIESLEKSGCSKDEATQLSYESGRSLTVLRRRLAKTPAIRTPVWASNPKAVQTLIPFLFAGTWKASNTDDAFVLELLADKKYAQLERELQEFLQYEDSPVWAADAFRGLVSKMDLLFSIHHSITQADIEHFIDIAQLVLSEDDPSLDLPKDKQWAASIYGKKRQNSSVLRESMCETITLLAVYGEQLFKGRFHFNIEVSLNNLVKDLLSPLTIRKLQAQAQELPAYAEIAPQTFIDILQEDLQLESPEAFKLLEPVDFSLFEPSFRPHLLWALEGLAWFEKYLVPVVDILAKLSQRKIADNLSSTPMASLSSILRWWMPQTSAPLETRIKILELLACKYPDIAWEICVDQIPTGHEMARRSHKFRWRKSGHGYGNPVPANEAEKFSQHAMNMAINWPNHTYETLGTLVRKLPNIPQENHNTIWDTIQLWAKTAAEESKSFLREQIRQSTFSRTAKIRRTKSKVYIDNDRAMEAYELLTPSNITLKHEWLFLQPWVPESLGELDDDIETRNKKVEELRKDALQEITSCSGPEGILELTKRVQTSHIVGALLAQLLSTEELIRYILLALKDENLSSKKFIKGALSSAPSETLTRLIDHPNQEKVLLTLELFPFSMETWNILQTQPADVQNAYWKNVCPEYPPNDKESLHQALENLISAGRPQTSFHLAQYQLELVQPRQLFEILEMLGSSNDLESFSYKIEAYYLEKSIEYLTLSAEFSLEEMAGLELKYIRSLGDSEKSETIPNLEKYIALHPEFYAYAIAMVYKRHDDNTDLDDLVNASEKTRTAYYTLLDKISCIPFHQNEAKMLSWIKQVKGECEKLSRAYICDNVLGKLFAKTPIGSDGLWPIEPARNILEKIMTQELSESLRIGLYNSRGVHWRSGGGDQERELSSKYQDWADGLRYSHPRTSRTLEKLAQSYLREADRNDQESIVHRRLGSWRATR